MEGKTQVDYERYIERLLKSIKPKEEQKEEKKESKVDSKVEQIKSEPVKQPEIDWNIFTNENI